MSTYREVGRIETVPLAPGSAAMMMVASPSRSFIFKIRKHCSHEYPRLILNMHTSRELLLSSFSFAGR